MNKLWSIWKAVKTQHSKEWWTKRPGVPWTLYAAYHPRTVSVNVEITTWKSEVSRKRYTTVVLGLLFFTVSVDRG